MGTDPGIDPGIDPGLRADWAVLGLAADVDRHQVTRAYRRLARATHPDVSPSPDAAARFAAVTNAYRRAIEATRARDAGRGETEPTVPRATRSRRSETNSLSGDGAVRVHVSTPMAQTRLGCETAEMILLRSSGLGAPQTPYPARLGSAPIVAGPVHVQPAGSVRPRSETWPGGAI